MPRWPPMQVKVMRSPTSLSALIPNSIPLVLPNQLPHCCSWMVACAAVVNKVALRKSAEVTLNIEIPYCCFTNEKWPFAVQKATWSYAFEREWDNRYYRSVPWNRSLYSIDKAINHSLLIAKSYHCLSIDRCNRSMWRSRASNTYWHGFMWVI